MTYAIAVERGEENLAELIHLYKAHFDQMDERLRGNGVELGAFKMNIPEYVRSWTGGTMINYVARDDGKAVGYCNMYLTTGMHTQDFIACEDALYVDPAHRNGLGRRLLAFVMADLKARGVKSVTIGSATDMRFNKLLSRMKFKELAVEMIYTFEGN